MSTGVALAKPLPTIYSNLQVHHHGPMQSFTPVFSVRPRIIAVITSDLGGELRLKWTSWTGSIAVGHGTSEPGIAVSPGQKQPIYPVSVRASRVVAGHFTRLEVTLHFSRKDVQVEHLHLTERDGQFNWAA